MGCKYPTILRCPDTNRYMREYRFALMIQQLATNYISHNDLMIILSRRNHYGHSIFNPHVFNEHYAAIVQQILHRCCTDYTICMLLQ